MRLFGFEALLLRLNQYAPKGGFVRSASALGGVTLVTQVLGIALSPVYSRLYSPADYGVFSVYNAIVATALTVGSLCYERGIPIAKDDREAVSLTFLAMSVLLLIGLGTTAYLGLQQLIPGLGSSSNLLGYTWLIPVGILGAGVYQVVRYWALRRKAINAIARTSLSQFGSATVINLGFGIFYPSPFGLILAGIAGYSSGLWMLARQTELVPLWREERQKGLGFASLFALAKKYRRLALVSAPSAAFNSIGIFLPNILLVPYYGADFAGQFFMGAKVIGLPVSLIGGALSQVFLSSAAAVARERPQELARFTQRIFLRGAACSVLIVVAGFVAPYIMPIVLGEKWREAGEIARWLAFYSAVGLSVSALSSIPSIVGRLQGQLLIDIGRALAVFLLLFWGHRAGWSGMTAVKGYVVVMIVNYLACALLYLYQVKHVARKGGTDWETPAPPA